MALRNPPGHQSQEKHHGIDESVRRRPLIDPDFSRSKEFRRAM